MKYAVQSLLGLASLGLASCATASAQLSEAPALSHAESKAAGHNSHANDEPKPYYADRDARADVDAAMALSKSNGTMTIVAMGANWCHDSRGLAAQFEKPRFQVLLGEHYELVYVDVGMKNRNMDIAERFGVKRIAGTPTVFVLNSEGDVLNLETAPTWRNAASRSEDDIWAYFSDFTKPE